MRTVIETPRYQSDASRLFTEDEQEAIIDLVASDPHCGVVIPGGGSVRKVRIGFGRWRRTCDLYLAATMCRYFCWPRLPRTSEAIGSGGTSGDGKRVAHAGELSETKMSKRAFDKIMQGVEEARADPADGRQAPLPRACP